MQNYLSTRYRRVHDKIKEVRRLDFKGKIPKSITEVKTMLTSLTPAANVTKEVSKFQYQLTSKISQFPYIHYWKKYWLVKCCTITMFVFMPTFYNFYKFNKSDNYEQHLKTDVKGIEDTKKAIENLKR